MGADEKSYLLGDYRLEPDKHLLTREGQPVRLQKKPFQVLLYLVENRDRLVTRAELLERFWEGQDVYEDTLRKSVAAVRKALDDQSEEARFVETCWGVGYRYVGPLEELISEESSVIEVEKTRGVRVVVEEEEIIDDAAVVEASPTVHAPTSASTSASVNPAPLQASNVHSPARRRRLAAIALTLVAVAAGGFSSQVTARAPARPKLTARPSARSPCCRLGT